MSLMRSDRAVTRSGVVLLATVLVLLLGAGPASAACRNVSRWVPDFSGESGGSLQLVLVCDDEPSTGPKTPAKKKGPTTKQLRTLRFEPRESVSMKVRRRLVDQLAKGPSAAIIAEEINRGRLLDLFHGKLGELGWSREDLADVYAEAYVLSWLAIDPKITRTSAAVDAAVREDVRRKLGLDATIRRMGDARQQELAEWLGAWTVVVLSSAQAIKARGDTAEFEAFRREASSLLATREFLGEDLTKVKLTRKGIERR